MQFHTTIIITIRDALPELRQCLSSLAITTSIPFRLILVDDCSDAPTSNYLKSLRQDGINAEILTNSESLGYTKSVNRGLRKSNSPYVVIANSDVVFTPGWDLKLLGALSSDPEAGIAGPMSNAASWQSLPDVLDETDDYAVNSLPDGWALNDFSQAIGADYSGRTMQCRTLNGFCLALKHEVLLQVGLFDEMNFPIGYGEEIDYCLRADTKGIKRIIALDAYIFHHKSRSFGNPRRKELSIRGRGALYALHGHDLVNSTRSVMRHDPELVSIREAVRKKYYAVASQEHPGA